MRIGLCERGEHTQRGAMEMRVSGLMGEQREAAAAR